MVRLASKSTVAALVAAGAGAIALVIWHRRRAARRAADFEARIRALGANPSVYDVAPHNILNFSQGSFALVEADLAAAFDGSKAAEAAAALRAAGIERAIALRREGVGEEEHHAPPELVPRARPPAVLGWSPTTYFRWGQPSEH